MTRPGGCRRLECRLIFNFWINNKLLFLQMASLLAFIAHKGVRSYIFYERASGVNEAKLLSQSNLASLK